MREVQSSWHFGWRGVLRSALVLGCLAACAAAPAWATSKYGPLEVSGNFETQNLVQNSRASELHFIQNRNTFRLRVDWDWLEKGKLINKINVPFLESSKLYVLYRGVYDGFYDIAPGGLVHGQTRFDDMVGGSINNVPHDQRTAMKWENTLREAYVDAKVKDYPVSLRIGRQQVIWGESDQFRIMDIWNPLDITWHFQQESWDNIRVPLWLAKGLWDIGQIGPLSNSFLEVVYNPFDFQPGIKAAFLPQPWALPFPDPLRTGQVQAGAVVGGTAGFLLSPRFDLQGTSLRKGNFERNPQDASEVGTRFHFVTPQGVEMSADYLYGRGRGVGAASPFAVKIEKLSLPFKSTDHPPSIGRFSDGTNSQPVAPIDVQAEVVHPYMHIFGLTGNYFEGDFTNTVWRFETAYAMGEPYQTIEEDKRVIVRYSDGVPAGSPKNPNRSPLGYTRRDIWTGMIGFDRPTWIRWLNSKATWFITGQVFWNYTTGNVNVLRGNSGAGDSPYFTPTKGIGSGKAQGVGSWITGSYTGQVERLQDGTIAGNGDDIRRWEHLVTIAGTSFYRSGTLVPFWAAAWDPVNSNLELLWNLDYYYSNDIIIQLQQKYFMQYGSGLPSNDPWFAGGRFSRRDETGVKITYQF
ncbi:MAG: hypothetical protein HY270_03980 [Deltaproteobacteria bacterium]|nr:hypothetical protein [Deltaproteobacteria bacterium]